jgi:hypothetical protein
MLAMAKPIPEEPPVTSAALSTEPSFQVGRSDDERAELGAGEPKGSSSPLNGGGAQRRRLFPEAGIPGVTST